MAKPKRTFNMKLIKWVELHCDPDFLGEVYAFLQENKIWPAVPYNASGNGRLSMGFSDEDAEEVTAGNLRIARVAHPFGCPAPRFFCYKDGRRLGVGPQGDPYFVLSEAASLLAEADRRGASVG
jgi:hypothetical protein